MKMLLITPYLKYSTQPLSEIPPPVNSTCVIAKVSYSVSTITLSHNLNMPTEIFFFFEKRKKKLVIETKFKIFNTSSIN